MDKNLGERIMAALSASTKPLNMAAELIELISDEDERKNFRKGIATVMAHIYTDLEYPIICQYKELDHDKLDPAEEQDDPNLTEEQALFTANLSQELVAQIDEALLAEAAHQWRKVARIVGSMMMSFPDRTSGIPDIYYAQRIAILVQKGLLEAQGNLRRMRFSEVRLTREEKPLSGLPLKVE